MEQIIGTATPSIARVEGRFGSGTGFIVRPNVLVTNAHVIRRERIADLKVRFVSRDDVDAQELPVELLYVDRPRDLALLQVDCSRAPLPLARSPRADDDRYILIGYPAPDEKLPLVRVHAVSIGRMSKQLVLLEKQSYYELMIAAHHGNSGGPVLDARGQVIGVLTAGRSDQKDTSYCIPSRSLQTALDKLGDRENWDDVIKQASARYLVEYLFLRLHVAGLEAATALEARATQRLGVKDDPTLGSEAAPSHVLAKFRRTQRVFDRAIQSIEREIRSNPHPPGDLNRVFNQYRDYYYRAVFLIDHPTGSPAEFKEKATNLIECLMKYDRMLSKQLNLTPEDLREVPLILD